jgi:hypothetical protein
MREKITAVLLFATLIVFASGIDVITSPLNNSYLKNNAINNISINVNTISSTLTSDTLKLYANGNLIYSNTVSANGIYPIPIFISTNKSNITITLYTSSNAKNETYVYYIAQNSFIQKLMQFMNIYIYDIIALIIASLLLFLRRNRILSIIAVFVLSIAIAYTLSITNIINESIYLVLLGTNILLLFYAIFSIF